MSARYGTTLIVILVGVIAGNASAQHIVPSAVLTIDQNRTTVVDRIVSNWGHALVQSGAGVAPDQLREILNGLRADHLLAASLAGTPAGLRDVIANALIATAPVKPSLLQAKALGDTSDDLVYTPIVPCRILDTRKGTVPPYNAPMVGGSAFPVAANLSSFAPQGGSATSCNLASSFQAIAVVLTVLNPNFDAFLAASSSSNYAALIQAIVMDFTANKGLANTAIVPVDGTVKFYLGLPASVTTNVIADAVGYFNRPTNYVGTHVITGLGATDSGGFNNTASGDYSTIAGGWQNISSGSYSTVGGGFSNTASGLGSTVAGGGTNTASGDASIVAGGYVNTAFGAFSFAAGSNAKANYDGCFVWGDSSTGNEVRCDERDRFVVRATHGIFMFTGGSSQGTYTGAVLPQGATAWIAGSDRASKDNLRSVNAKDVLRKVAAMPVATWNWKSQDASIRHMGPMAQDFHAAFGLGETPKGISTIDADGVAFAAIQGLHQLLQQKDVKLRAQERKFAAMERELAAIKEKLNMR